MNKDTVNKVGWGEGRDKEGEGRGKEGGERGKEGKKDGENKGRE